MTYPEGKMLMSELRDSEVNSTIEMDVWLNFAKARASHVTGFPSEIAEFADCMLSEFMKRFATSHK